MSPCLCSKRTSLALRLCRRNEGNEYTERVHNVNRISLTAAKAEERGLFIQKVAEVPGAKRNNRRAQLIDLRVAKDAR